MLRGIEKKNLDQPVLEVHHEMICPLSKLKFPAGKADKSLMDRCGWQHLEVKLGQKSRFLNIMQSRHAVHNLRRFSFSLVNEVKVGFGCSSSEGLKVFLRRARNLIYLLVTNQDHPEVEQYKDRYLYLKKWEHIAVNIFWGYIPKHELCPNWPKPSLRVRVPNISSLQANNWNNWSSGWSRCHSKEVAESEEESV